MKSAFFKSAVVTAFCFLFPGSLPAVAGADATSHEAYTLSQSCMLNGDYTIYVSDKGLAAYSKKATTCMLCLPPYNEVYLFNEGTKKYYTTPFKDFRCPVSKTLAVVSGSLLLDAPMVPAKDASYSKMAVHTFTSAAQFSAKQHRAYIAKEIPGRGVFDVKAYTTTDLKCDDRLGTVLSRFYGLPKMTGFPVFVEYHDLGGDNNKYLLTPKFSRGLVADSRFVLPTGLTKVKLHQDLFVGEDTADGMGLMMLGH